MLASIIFFFFFFNDTATTEIYTLSLHDALPIYQHLDGVNERNRRDGQPCCLRCTEWRKRFTQSGVCHCRQQRSEEHTSELQSPCNLVCRLLLEKKKKK